MPFKPRVRADMKKWIYFIFHFFGGLNLALGLIACAALFVAAGTFIEGRSGSHLLAAYWTYHNRAFIGLLFLFFINILFAALRRWPFKKKHIPFLVTHLGLLMLIAGVLIKNRWGLQGMLTVWEGEESEWVHLPHSQALSIENRGNRAHFFHRFESLAPHDFSCPGDPVLRGELIAYAPHVVEKMETWIKGNHLQICGYPLIGLTDWGKEMALPQATAPLSAALAKMGSPHVIALRTDEVQEAVRAVYLSQTALAITGRREEKLFMPLAEALSASHAFMGGVSETTLFLKQGQSDRIEAVWSAEGSSKMQAAVYLNGADALLTLPVEEALPHPIFSIDLIRSQHVLLVIEDREQTVHFFAFDTCGRAYREGVDLFELEKLAVYDGGFRGYRAQIQLPLCSPPSGRGEKERAAFAVLEKRMRDVLVANPLLNPPLELFKEACQEADIDFVSGLVAFLSDWYNQKTFLFSSSRAQSPFVRSIFEKIKWEKISIQDRSAAAWTAELFELLQEGWNRAIDPFETLEGIRWPFLESLREASAKKTKAMLNAIAEQIFALADKFPLFELKEQRKEEVLSAYFRAYGIDPTSLLFYRAEQKESVDPFSEVTQAKEQAGIELETVLAHRLEPIEQRPKLEDLRPGIVVAFEEGNKRETLTLAYDKTGRGLSWPLMNGRYLVRFEPYAERIPYRIGLIEARQIAYPQSNQIYSYEAQISLSCGDRMIFTTLSMNHVFETEEGFRFYLSGISHSVDGTKKGVHLAVNYDPVKYWLTYPGAVLVCLGAIVLFFRKKPGKGV